MKKSELRNIIKEELLIERQLLPVKFDLFDKIEPHYDAILDILVQVSLDSKNDKWKMAGKSLINDIKRFNDNLQRYSHQLGNVNTL